MQNGIGCKRVVSEGNGTFNKWKIFSHMVKEGVTLNHSTREKLYAMKNAKVKRGQAESSDPSKNLLDWKEGKLQ